MKGKSIILTINGKTQTVTEWAKQTGIPAPTIKARFRAGKPADQLLAPVQKKGQKTAVKIQGRAWTLASLAEITGLEMGCLQTRYYRGHRGKDILAGREQEFLNYLKANDILDPENSNQDAENQFTEFDPQSDFFAKTITMDIYHAPSGQANVRFSSNLKLTPSITQLLTELASNIAQSKSKPNVTLNEGVSKACNQRLNLANRLRCFSA